MGLSELGPQLAGAAIATAVPPLPPLAAEPISDDELIRERALRGLEDIWFFQQEILQVGKEDDLPRDEAEIRPMLDWFAQPRPVHWNFRKKFLLYSSFPRHTGKSYCLATFCAWTIVKNPNIAIMITQEQKDMAVELVDLIRDWLECERLIQCYGLFKPAGKGWAGEAVKVRQRTTSRKDPTILASGMDVPQQGRHPDISIWDDLVGDTNNSLEGYKKVNQRISGSMPVLRQGGRGIFNGTRWGEEDPAGKILERAYKGWAKDAPTDCTWVAPPGRGFFGAYAVEGDEVFFNRSQVTVGEPLFPSILDDETIEGFRKELSPDHFASQILNDPAPLEGRIFLRENYQYFDPYKRDPNKPDMFSEMLIDELREGFPYLAIDPAGGKEHTERGDDSVIGCGFGRWVGPTPQLWCVDFRGGRWKPDKIIDTFFNMFELWGPVKIFAEVNILKEWLLDPLRKRAQMMGIHLPIEEVHWGKGDAKKERIKSLVTPYTYRQIFHARSMKSGKLERQQSHWQPGGKVHDDWLDVEAMFWLCGLTNKKRKRQPNEGIKVASFNKSRIRYRRTGV
jgi:hypothetical protein